MMLPGRRAGLMLPLFSLRSRRDWGIGEIGDLETSGRVARRGRPARAAAAADQRDAARETSPYSALSAMAIDPQFISLATLEDFAALGGEKALERRLGREADGRSRGAAGGLSRACASSRITPCGARSRTSRREVRGGTPRARAFRDFLRRRRGGSTTTRSSARCIASTTSGRGRNGRRRCATATPHALAAARARLADEIRYRQYLQWVAGEQWRAARQPPETWPLRRSAVHGGGDSADVWARQDEFRLDASVGVPPDAFSETGQDWGLPVYRWDVMERGASTGCASRARRNADLFDGYRVDHLVGFYRTYFREPGGGAGFTPADEPAQVALGERVLRVFLASGAEIIAEDLGVVPDFVRESLARLGVPGLQGLPLGAPLADAGTAVRGSGGLPRPLVATSGTHDTEPMVIWWARRRPRSAPRCCSCPSCGERLGDRRHADAPRSDPRHACTRCSKRSSPPVRPADPARPGRLRLARSHQPAGRRGRRELDVAAAVARRDDGRSAGRWRRGEAAQRPGIAARPVEPANSPVRKRPTRESRSVASSIPICEL